jgi:multidrug efflux pump
LKEISKTLGETIAIVALIVFLFMGSIRTVLVPLIAMPISLVGACLAMLVFGFSLNLLTILAIVLSVGLVVDDAIVMVENVERHVREGRTRLDAALLGARELFSPVISMTITLAAVYAPIGFQGGLTGVLFKEFAFTLAAAVVISGVVAITLSPVMSAALVPAHGHEGWLTRTTNRVFDGIRRFYGRLLDVHPGLRWTMAFAAVLIAAAAPILYSMSKKELAPTEDEGGVFFVLQSAPDASIEYTRRSAEGLNSALQNFPETKNVWQVLFINNGFGGMQAVEWNKRERRPPRSSRARPSWPCRACRGCGSSQSSPRRSPAPGSSTSSSCSRPMTRSEWSRRSRGSSSAPRSRSGKFLFADTDLKIDLPQTRLRSTSRRSRTWASTWPMSAETSASCSPVGMSTGSTTPVAATRSSPRSPTPSARTESNSCSSRSAHARRRLGDVRSLVNLRTETPPRVAHPLPAAQQRQGLRRGGPRRHQGRGADRAGEPHAGRSSRRATH